jgi:hypothetical protein
MYGNYLSIAIGELLAATTSKLYIIWKFIIVVLLIAVLIEIIIPFFRRVGISRTVATRRAKIDTKIKFDNKGQTPGKLRKVFNKLTKFIRKPAYYFRRYLFHYKNSKRPIARMNRLRAYQKNKTRSYLFKFIARYYAIVIITTTFLFSFYFIYVRMQYQE